MSVKRNDQDYELLSAYIDGALTDAERAALESRLESNSQLRQELASLRQTVDLIRQLPDLKAPRDFTLDAARVRPRRTLPFPLTQTFSALSSAAAILLVIFGAYLLLQSDAAALNSNLAVQQAQAPASQNRTTAVAAANFCRQPLSADPGACPARGSDNGHSSRRRAGSGQERPGIAAGRPCR